MRKLLFVISAVVSLALILASIYHRIELTLTEVLAFVTGGYCVWLTVEENIWNWPIGIANNVLFLLLFWHTALFSDSALQVVYIVLGILGWYWWVKGGPNRSTLHVSSITPRTAGVLFVITIASTLGMTRFLTTIHDSAPFWDAFTTVLSLVAQYLLCKKMIENWPVWMFADVIYVGLYQFKHLHLTAILYGLFFVMCIQGFRYWQRSIKNNAVLVTQPLMPLEAVNVD